MHITVEPVRLKSFLGMQPGVYLTILYAIILLAVIFLVGFLPGLLKSGKRVTFTSSVTPAAVTVDGTYVGSAPVTAFIQPGMHEAVYSFGDDIAGSVRFEVSRPLFLTWLFPRRQDVSMEGLIDSVQAFGTYLRQMFDEVVLWAVPSTDDRYHRPPLLTQVASSANNLAIAGTGMLLRDFYASSFAYIETEAMLSDAEDALALLAGSGILDHRSLEELGQQLEAIASILEARNSAMTGLEAYDIPIGFSRTSLEVPVSGFPAVTGFSYAGGPFVMGTKVESRYPQINRMGIEVEVQPFSIAALETSEYQWARFIEANPYWAKTNIDRLVADGMVDDRYLAGLFPTVTVPSNRPVRNISWHAAQAYVGWLSEVSGRDVFLPSQAQWEFAAASVKDRVYQNAVTAIADSKGPSGMMGGYWEFTSDPYIPFGRYVKSERTLTSSHSDIVVKGGSYLNDPAAIQRTTVGMLSRTECAETTGFRIAWTD